MGHLGEGLAVAARSALAAAVSGEFPEPDRAEIRRFVELIFGRAGPAGWVNLRAFVEGKIRQPYRPGSWRSVRVGDGLEAIVEAAFEVALMAASAEMSVAFAAPLATFKEPKKARERDLAEGLAVSVECDERPLASWEKLADLLGPPSLVVASGGEWIDLDTGEVQSKLHLHWLLQEPAREFAELVRLTETRRIACALIAGDPTGYPVAHPYRWPGTWWRKAGPRYARIYRAE